MANQWSPLQSDKILLPFVVVQVLDRSDSIRSTFLQQSQIWWGHSHRSPCNIPFPWDSSQTPLPAFQGLSLAFPFACNTMRFARGERTVGGEVLHDLCMSSLSTKQTDRQPGADYVCFLLIKGQRFFSARRLELTATSLICSTGSLTPAMPPPLKWEKRKKNCLVNA